MMGSIWTPQYIQRQESAPDDKTCEAALIKSAWANWEQWERDKVMRRSTWRMRDHQRAFYRAIVNDPLGIF
jgi:acyl-CoA reductase-like NAD-dependent aldehyde dehydrogenase